MKPLWGAYSSVDTAAQHSTDSFYEAASKEPLKIMVWLFSEIMCSQFSSRATMYMNGSTDGQSTYLKIRGTVLYFTPLQYSSVLNV